MAKLAKKTVRNSAAKKATRKPVKKVSKGKAPVKVQQVLGRSLLIKAMDSALAVFVADKERAKALGSVRQNIFAWSVVNKTLAQMQTSRDSFYEEIRKNTKGIAVKYHCDRTKDGEGYAVPPCVRQPMAKVIQSKELGINLNKKVKGKSIPKTAIELDADIAAAKIAKGTETATMRNRREIREALDGLKTWIEKVKKADDDDCAAAIGIIKSASAQLQAVIGRNKKRGESPAEALKKAA